MQALVTYYSADEVGFLCYLFAWPCVPILVFLSSHECLPLPVSFSSLSSATSKLPCRLGVLLSSLQLRSLNGHGGSGGFPHLRGSKGLAAAAEAASHCCVFLVDKTSGNGTALQVVAAMFSSLARGVAVPPASPSCAGCCQQTCRAEDEEARVGFLGAAV